MEHKNMKENFIRTYRIYKPKFHGLLALTAISAAVFAVALNALNNQLNASSSAKIDLHALVTLRDNLSKNLDKERDNEDSIKSFLVDWSPYLSPEISAVRILEELEQIAHSKSCEITKKSTATAQGKDFPIATIKTSYVGDLNGLLNFLSAAEEQFPMMKIGDIDISERANVLTLDLTFKYPMFNEKA
jgi:hypothetical protein